MAQNPTISRKPYVRIVTDKRREQNRRAQKAYRERLKKKLEDLEEQAAGNGAVPVSRPNDVDGDGDSMSEDHFEEVEMRRGYVGDGVDEDDGAHTSIDGNPLDNSHDSGHDRQYSTRTEGQSSHYIANAHSNNDQKVINLADAFAAAGDLPFGQGSLPGIPFQIAPPTPEPDFDEETVEHLHEDYGDIDMCSIWSVPTKGQQFPSPPTSLSGSKSSLVLTPRRTPNIYSPSRSSTADPYLNHMRLVGEGNIEASIAVGLTLRISRSQYVNDHPSHFPSCYVFLNKPDPHSPTNSISARTVPYKIDDKYMQISPELRDHLAEVKQPMRPTFAQLLHPHPTYLDCIVFPHFRELAVKASVDGILDHPQLFLDLMNGGLVCWGGMSGLSNRHGRATKSGKRDMRESVAWSTRSWEAQKWFLKKWTWLVGTEDDEDARGDVDGIWRASRWWWTMRGDDDSDEEDDDDGLNGTGVRVSEVQPGLGEHCL